MKFNSIEDIKIPDAFTYLCSATGYNDVNLIPLYHFATGRIKKLVIQVGIQDPEKKQSDIVLANASRPASWLLKFVIKEFGIAPTDIELIPGHPDDIACWETGITWAEQFDLPILANLQGGTTQMSIGASEALMRSHCEVMRLFVGKAAAVTLASVVIGDNQKIVALPVTKESKWIPVEVMLDARDCEIAPPKDHNKAPYLMKHAIVAKQMLQRFCPVEPSDPLLDKRREKLNELKSAIKNHDGQSALDLSRRTSFIEMLGEDICASAPWKEGRLDKPQRDFFSGDWFEQAIFDLINKHCPSSADFEYRLNVSIRQTEKNKQPTMNEVDIFVKKRNILNLLEVKTAAGPEFIVSSIDRLSGVKHALTSPLAKAWLCVPLYVGTPEVSADEMTSRAEKKGVTLLTGKNAVARLLGEIKRLP
jgi:hypothetical protein